MNRKNFRVCSKVLSSNPTSFQANRAGFYQSTSSTNAEFKVEFNNVKKNISLFGSIFFFSILPRSSGQQANYIALTHPNRHALVNICRRVTIQTDARPTPTLFGFRKLACVAVISYFLFAKTCVFSFARTH